MRAQRSKIKTVALVALAAAVLWLLWSLWANSQSRPAMDRVVVETDSGIHSWTVELANTAALRQKGLMFRKSMPKGQGMLFHFDQNRPVSMWMENTFLPLDMIFLRSDGRIANIHANTTPLSRTVLSSAGPVRFVLEINGGQAAEIGLEADMVMQHPLFDGSASP